MLQNVLTLSEEYDMLPRGGTVLCAVSGGKDSMCLLHLLWSLRETGGFTLAAAHFNHRLRGAESDRDAAFVEHRCQEWDIPCLIDGGDVKAEAARVGKGIEETARALRYAFLRRAAGTLNAARIATAHNADDNAETLLLHLVRGSGLQGLTGIPPRRGEIVRPLLTTGRAEIESYLAEHGIPHVEDSSNADESYSRNKIRAQVMPVLQALNPRFSEHSAETMARLRADNDYLNARAAEACLSARWAEDDLVIEARCIADLPAAIAPRAVRRLLEMMGDGTANCAASHLLAVVELARGEDPSAVAFLPNGWLAQRVYKELLITTQIDPADPFLAVPLNLDGETAPAGTGWKVVCRREICPAGIQPGPGQFYLAAAGLAGQPVIRPRQVGDEVKLPRRAGTKSVKKLMIDGKIPRRDRERIPVLADEKGVLAVAGFGPDKTRLAAPGEDALSITMIGTEVEREEWGTC